MTEEDPITRVARALCVLDGHDPDEMIYLASEFVETEGAEHHREIMSPAWVSHLGKAGRLVTAMIAAAR